MKFILLVLSISLYGNCIGKSYKDAPTVPYLTQEICYEQYGVLYSKEFKVPLASYEKLTKESVAKSTLLKRKDAFHSEPLHSNVRPLDYLNSGYDRGHMAPCDDMPTPKAQYESFSMLNMVPQRHGNNAGAWKVLETKARTMALLDDVFIVSGALIEGNETKIRNNIVVPKLLYKAIMTKGNIIIYVIDNTDKPTVIMYDNEAFKTKYKINPFGI